MRDLRREKCAACRSGTTRLRAAEIRRLRTAAPGWSVVRSGGISRLRKVFRFPDFARAMSFARRIAEAADRQDHHPALLVEWGKTTVEWWTHAAKGLHRNDFIMAARTDALFRRG